MARVRYSTWLAVAGALLLLAGCAPPAPPLRIGLSSWPPFEYLHLAREKGFFREEGVDVRLIEFISMSDARRSFEHEQIDGGMFSIFEVLRSRDMATRDMQVVMVVDFSDGADALLARPGIEDVASLRGRTIGIDPGALGIYMADRALALNGLSMQDVKLVSVEDSGMVPALASGKVDAVVNYPPFRATIEAAGAAHPVFTSSQIPGEIVDVLAMDEKVTRERPEDVARLIRAYYRAVAYAREHPEEAMAIMAQREQIDVDTFRKSLADGIALVPLEEQDRFLGAGSQLPAVVELIGRVLHQNDLLSKPSTADGLLAPAPAGIAQGR